MRFGRYKAGGKLGLAAAGSAGEAFHGFLADQAGYPGDLDLLVAGGTDALEAAAKALAAGAEVDLEKVELLPPLARPGKIICVGLNYVDHTKETGFEQPDYPLIFTRFPSTLVGHGAPVQRPRISETLDYECEFVAVIGKGGKHISHADALDHVIAYSLFNDVSVREFQKRTPQWTVGKNFDTSGPFGPYLVTADELPLGASGLRIQTRLNGEVMQDANTRDLVFDVATLISTLSEAFSFEPGDIIVTGTCAGVGVGRTPPVWMKDGDVVEVEVEGIGVLRNVIVDEA